MLALLNPSPTLTEQDVRVSLRMMVWEGVASGAMFSLASGGFLAAYALALGANNLQVGVLAAIPFVTQVAQLPVILAVERFRRRKAIGVPAWYAAQLMWLPIGVIPFLIDTPGPVAVAAVIGLLALRGLFAPVWATTWTSWMRDLVPRNILGSYYGRRLAIITGTVAVVSLAGSFFVRWWEDVSSPDDTIFAYSFLLIGGSIAFGLAGPSLALRAKEPLMSAVRESSRSAVAILVEPLRDQNFSKLLRFLFVWSLTSNLAIPFFAIYMLRELELSLPTVIGFTVLSQLSNILFVRVWGPMADRLGSKTVLSMAASLYLLVILGWVFTAYPDTHVLTLPLLALLHVFAGIAGSGVALTTHTLTLKLAPDGKATPFLGMASIGASIGAGIGPIVGGLMADFFAVRSLQVDLSWTSPSGVVDVPALSLTGYDFLFAIAFLLGLLSLNLLAALREEGEAPREVALGELMARASPAARTLSSVPGLGAAASFSYSRLKRVPGADVAIGVTAYQLAASTQAAVRSAGRGRALARNVAEVVGGALGKSLDGMEDIRQHGLEVARHATRGAVQVGDDLADHVGRVARGAVMGTLHTLAEKNIPALDALRGAGYGTVQGVVESGQDPGEAVAEAVEAARQAAAEFDVDPNEAAAALAAGALDAAAISGEEALMTVRNALPSSLGVSERDE
ncbi:MAG: MFS transporter [Chloroflexi bacterium]|nr:MFS transporter [Chloroflexota bacterium]MCY3939321.1 MFS transporter [Chloroflexota bacterium]